MSCELSCTILGFIPCNKYRNRITCKRDYSDLIGKLYNDKNSRYKQNSMHTSLAFIKNFFRFNSLNFYILGK